MIEIIPATDIIDGQCVRLTQGDYASRKTYYRDPLEAALRFEEAGIRRLHMVDLDGAKASDPRNLAVLERVATRTGLEVQYGGSVAIQGWLESSALSAPELIGRFLPQGLAQVICTDISRDGMLCGPSAAFYAELQSRFPAVEITVSGGISGMDDIGELDRQGLRSVIVGKALYEGRITLKELERCLRNA